MHRPGWCQTYRESDCPSGQKSEGHNNGVRLETPQRDIVIWARSTGKLANVSDDELNAFVPAPAIETDGAACAVFGLVTGNENRYSLPGARQADTGVPTACAAANVSTVPRTTLRTDPLTAVTNITSLSTET
eukprot:1105378-Rhodomonas_salina.4